MTDGPRTIRLYKSKLKSGPSYPCRWVVALVFDWRNLMLSWHDEFQLDASKDTWRHGARYRSVLLSTNFDIGSTHFWHDGSHCSFSIGWLCFAWGFGDCQLARSYKHEETWFKRWRARVRGEDEVS